MRRALRLHPDSRREAVSRIDVEIARGPDDSLVLQYRTTGIPAFPPPPQSLTDRADDLWRHTCFEVFIRPPTGEGYFEFNFSPDLRWAAYAFDGYRRNRRDLELPPPGIETRRVGSTFELRAELHLGRLADLARGCRLAISAVIEDDSGHISYWALNHPPGKPDFHHADGFALELHP